jgi:hypothetical protein
LLVIVEACWLADGVGRNGSRNLQLNTVCIFGFSRFWASGSQASFSKVSLFVRLCNPRICAIEGVALRNEASRFARQALPNQTPSHSLQTYTVHCPYSPMTMDCQKQTCVRARALVSLFLCAHTVTQGLLAPAACQLFACLHPARKWPRRDG